MIVKINYNCIIVAVMKIYIYRLIPLHDVNPEENHVPPQIRCTVDKVLFLEWLCCSQNFLLNYLEDFLTFLFGRFFILNV